MKKFFSILLILFVSVSFSQRWAAYGIKVSPQNEEAVVGIIDQYFTNNPIEGVTVSLFSVLFTQADLNFTHEIILDGDPESISKFFTPGFQQQTGWQLFSSKINAFIEETVFSANGWRAFEFGEVMPFQMVNTFSADNENVNKWRNMARTLNEKYPRDYRSFATGGISVGGPTSEANSWMVTGWKTYEDYLANWSNNRKFAEDNPKFAKEREKMTAEIDYSEFEPVAKFMRYLVKQW